MKQKDLLFIFISVTLVVGLWIVFSVLHNTITSTISATTAENIIPINGTFDTKTLSALKKRANIDAQSAVLITPTPTPTPTVAPITPVSPLQILTVPVASSGGTTQ